MATEKRAAITGDPSWIEPACPACLAVRRETNGRETWCATHAEPHARPHALRYHTDSVEGDEQDALHSTPDRVADDRAEVRDKS